MALSELQKKVLRILATTRSPQSYLAGGIVLNRDWPRQSDDFDVFHDRDEDVVETARRDKAALVEGGFLVRVDVEVYGCVEVTASSFGEATIIQWMGETRRRFFPLVTDSEWGFRLSQADLAVNKVIAASCRSKARDFIDLLSIEQYFCAIGPLILAASGKPPHFSPQRIVDEIRRRGLSIGDEEYQTVKAVAPDWLPTFIRNKLIEICESAENYVQSAPVGLVGVLVVDPAGKPVAYDHIGQTEYRKATDEKTPVPMICDPHP